MFIFYHIQKYVVINIEKDITFRHFSEYYVIIIKKKKKKKKSEINKKSYTKTFKTIKEI